MLTLVIGFNVGCSKNDSPTPTDLESYLNTKTHTIGDVIACAGSNKDNNQILVYFFPRIHTSNYKLYLSNNSNVEKTNFKEYTWKNVTDTNTIGNTLRAFELENTIPNLWAIVSFEENNQISFSNPINLKHLISPTIYNNQVDITPLQKPIFKWENTLGKDHTKNAIYFQILNNKVNQLLSGTYTLNTNYTYLNNSNVILTITPNNNTSLKANENYNFLVMGVSEDNWINFISDKTFKINP